MRGLAPFVEAQAAGMETVARCLLHRSDEQCRHLEIADEEPRLAQPARGTDRGAAFVEAQPAAKDRLLAGVVDSITSALTATIANCPLVMWRRLAGTERDRLEELEARVTDLESKLAVLNSG